MRRDYHSEAVMKKGVLTGCSLLVGLILFIPFVTVQAAAILKVGPGWTYADIQSAIDAAADNDEIWVEQGTYALSAMITVDKKLGIYGGFSGSETLR